MALLVTALGVHHLLSQAGNTQQVSQAPAVNALEIPTAVVEPLQATANPSQLFDHTSQVAVELSRRTIDSTPQLVGEPAPQPTLEPSQFVPMNSTATPITQESSTEAVIIPGVPYRIPNPATVASGAHLRRDSIDGAPGMMFDFPPIPEVQYSFNDIEPELTVDLRAYLNIDGDSDDETHVSSSQRTIDGSRDLLPPTSDSQRQRSGFEGAEGVVNVDEDLPTWMVKRGQWRYIVSTAGGPVWQNLLNLYMKQERRLAFTETVGYHARIFPTPGAK